MTEMLERRRQGKVAARLPERLSSLRRAVELGQGRVPGVALATAERIVDRTGHRLALSPDHTVVALAGSTGSGKSTLFNALAELDLATVGVRRPTTSTALACVWGSERAQELLDWLGIDRRHQVMRSSVLESVEATDLRGLVLIDLPDHDSTEVSHRLEVRRLVDLVDMLVWVVDPEKYADAALHDDFLQPLASHAGVMAVVLNQSDRLTRSQVTACQNDLRRLLDDDGLQAAPLVVTSARNGHGVPRLRALVAQRVLARQSFAKRVAADLDAAASGLSEACGSSDVPEPSDRELTALRDGLAQAAGVDGISVAARRSYEQRATASTGWPPIRWVGRFRPDPLRRLGLGASASSTRPDLVRTSRPTPTPVQRAQVDAAVRRYADVASGGLPAVWARSTRRAAWARSDDLPDAVDNAIARTDVGAQSTPAWWRLLSGLQWILLAALVVGAGWLGLLAVGTYVGLPDLPTPRVADISLPILLVGGGALLGLVLAFLARPARRLGARRIQARTAKQLRDAVGSVADDLVVAPVREELDRLREIRAVLADVSRAK